MSEIGAALYRKLTRGRSPATEPRTLGQALATLVKRAGSVAAAARVVDMPRKTIADWISGRRKPSKRSAEKVDVVVRAAVAVERRARLTPGRERTQRGADRALKFVVDQEGRTGRREIELGRYLRDGTMDRVVDAYLSGAPLAEIHRAMHAGITDSFYRGMFSRGLPAGGSASVTAAPRRAPTGGGGLDDMDDEDFDGYPEEDPYDDEAVYDDYDDMRGEENHDFDHDAYGISGAVAA